MAPVTLRDVARKAKVHPSTVSRALNDHTRGMVSEAMVQHVLKTAKELGYRPNSLARGLKMAQSFTIGMLVPDLTNPLFPPIVRGIEDALVEAGYTLVVANTDNDEAKEASVIEAMVGRRIDGLILATARREYPLLEQLESWNLPFVLVNRTADDPGVSSVAGDDHAGIGLAVRHLKELGHDRVAHVAGTQTVSTGVGRYHAFLAWMQSLGLHLDHDLIVFSNWFRESEGAKAFRALLERRQDFTAVVTANDLLALGCYAACRELGLRVPEDMSIVGYNDIPFCDKFAPPLTSVRLPQYQIGVKAAELLINALDEQEHTPVALRLFPTLAVRESTAPPRAD